MHRLSEDTFADVLEWIETRWPGTRWLASAERVASLFPDFSRVPERALWKAVHELYEQGRKSAPSPSELLAAAKAHSRTDVPEGVDPTDPDFCRHPRWAIFHLAGGMREAICVACDATRTGMASALPTAGETSQKASTPHV
ncbi:MAG: hypothetical protein P1T08_12905 [Acidimicrobiia bacterium]|nr:hypothetical protein [Acidimicrobiia bacterium]